MACNHSSRVTCCNCNGSSGKTSTSNYTVYPITPADKVPTPPPGTVVMFQDSDGELKYKDDVGAVHSLKGDPGVNGLVGPITFTTKALMDANLNWDAGVLAQVTQDPVPDNNIQYVKSGASGTGSWTPTFDRVSLLASQVTYSVESIAALRLVTNPQQNVIYNVLGYYAKGDGGGGNYYYDSASSATDDGGAVIAPTSGSGRFIGIFTGTIYPVQRFGARVSTASTYAAANTSAINAAIAAMPEVAGSFGGASGTLDFPSGVIVSNGGHVVPNNKRVIIRGAGWGATTLYANGSVGGDMLTINSPYSVIRDMGFDGHYSSNVGGTYDGVVLNGSYTAVENVSITGFAADGLKIGKAAAALYVQLSNLKIRQCKGYGIRVVAASGSTDGIWNTVDVGQCGLSGIRISNGAQNLTNVHSWGNGLESSSDYFGFYIDSSSNIFEGCQSETNRGAGVYFYGSGSKKNTWTGGRVWGNGLNAFFAQDCDRGMISGVTCHQNGVNNSAGSSSTSFAQILLDNANYWNIETNKVWDDASAVPAGDLTSWTYSFGGRSAVYTAYCAYAEVNGSDYNTIVGNALRKEDTRGAVSCVIVGNNNRMQANNYGAVALPTRSIASNNIRAPSDSDTIIAAASQEIHNVLGGYPGRRVTIIFTNSSPSAVISNTNLLLPSNYTPSQNGYLNLVSYDGTTWYEMGRGP